MRILVTGASGVLGQVTALLLRQRAHVLATPSSREPNLFDAGQVGAAIDTADGGAIAASLDCRAGVYNVVDDASPVSHALFTRVTGWRPQPVPTQVD